MLIICRLFQNVNYFETNFLFPMRLIKQFNCLLTRRCCPDYEFYHLDNIYETLFMDIVNRYGHHEKRSTNLNI